jgi:hypothetical protein
VPQNSQKLDEHYNLFFRPARLIITHATCTGTSPS